MKRTKLKMLALSGSITAGLCLSFQLVTPVFFKHLKEWRPGESKNISFNTFKSSAQTHEIKAKPALKNTRKSYAS